MFIEYHKWYSDFLQRDMELKVYGNYGLPLLVFPAAGGRFFDYEDNKMIEVLTPFIDGLKLKVITIDSMDKESWLNGDLFPEEKGRMHSAYESYVVNEVIPFIYDSCQQQGIDIITTGSGFGAFHAANFFFKHPWLFNKVIGLSGIYSLSFSVGEFCDDTVYYNNPVLYLQSLNDPQYLELYKKSQIILGVGQGSWEGFHLDESYRLSSVLKNKNIPHWMDIWGEDVNHDWYWWRKMITYYVEKLDL